VPNFPRLRALALFGRRSVEPCGAFLLPASKNLHITGLIRRSKWHHYSITSSADCWRCNGASRPRAFVAFTLITEVREFDGDVFNVGQN
jgi:hypothetical protein